MCSWPRRSRPSGGASITAEVMCRARDMAGAAPFDPLEGPRKRLGRFTSQTRSLGELLAAHMERAAYPTVREVAPETGDIVWRAAIGEPIPGEISERLGEIVDTLRSPLDEI